MKNKIHEYLKQIDKVIQNGRYTDTWESLSQFKVPEWYMRKKLGIFIHWGIYSVPAFGDEWYSRRMYIKDDIVFKHHVEKYGSQKDFGYKDFIPLFKGENFDADNWAEIIEKSGAGYVIPVAEHHDGFAMYDSDLSNWTAKKLGPCRNVLGELKQAFEKRKMVFGVSTHRAEHWWFMGGGREFESDIKNPEYGDMYWPSMNGIKDEDFSGTKNFPPSEEFLQDFLVRTCELIDKYKPKILYFDWWIQQKAFRPYLRKIAAYYYNRSDEWGIPVLINYKSDAFMIDTAVIDIERGQFKEMKREYWQTDTSVANNSWGYTENNEYKSPNSIICQLVDIVSKNGNLLLNIGPKSDGTIPKEDQNILFEIGKWLKVNGEAIYDTQCWKIYGEGHTQIKEGSFTDYEEIKYTSEDIRFTYSKGCIYAIVLKWPEDGVVKIKSLGEKSGIFVGQILDIKILDDYQKPQWIRLDDSLTINADFIKSQYPVCFKIVID